MTTTEIKAIVQLIEKDDADAPSRIPIEEFDCQPNVFEEILTSLTF